MSGIFYKARGEIDQANKASREHARERQLSRDNLALEQSVRIKDEVLVGGALMPASPASAERDENTRNYRPQPLQALKQAGARGVLQKMKAKMEEAMLLQRLDPNKIQSEDDQLQLSLTPRSEAGEEDCLQTDSERDHAKSALNMSMSGCADDTEEADEVEDEERDDIAETKVSARMPVSIHEPEEEETSESGSDTEQRRILARSSSARPKFKLLLPTRTEDDIQAGPATISLPIVRNRSSSFGCEGICILFCVRLLFTLSLF